MVKGVGKAILLVVIVVAAAAIFMGLYGTKMSEGFETLYVTFNDIAMNSKFILVFLLGLVATWGFAESAIGGSKDMDIKMFMYFFVATGAIIFIYGSTCQTENCPYFRTMSSLSSDMGVSSDGSSNIFWQIVGAFVLVVGLLLVLNFGDFLKEKLNVKIGRGI